MVELEPRRRLKITEPRSVSALARIVWYGVATTCSPGSATMTWCGLQASSQDAELLACQDHPSSGSERSSRLTTVSTRFGKP